MNGGAGARFQVSGLVVAALAVVTLLFLTGLFEQLPEATLGAVVIAAVVELIDFSALARLYRLWTSRLGTIYGLAARTDFVEAVAAMLGVLIFDTLHDLFPSTPSGKANRMADPAPSRPGRSASLRCLPPTPYPSAGNPGRPDRQTSAKTVAQSFLTLTTVQSCARARSSEASAPEV